MPIPEQTIVTLPWRALPNPANALAPPISSSLLNAEAKALRDLSTDVKAVLEIGTAYGYSAIQLALGGANVCTVDPHTGYGAMHDSLERLRCNLYKAGEVGERVVPIVATSQVALPGLCVAGARFDVVFIDGDHRRDAVLFDVEWAEKLLRPGGVIAAHDYDEVTCPGVREALDHRFDEGPDELIGTLWMKHT